MKKILVTTDFSNASKAGLRFAIQLATQTDVELVFFHCFQAMIPTTIHRENIDKAVREQTEEHLAKLDHFITSIHHSMEVSPGANQLVVVENLDLETAILDYAHQHECQFICMSTRGAGTIQKIVGTHTSWVIQRSFIPVLVVPHNYRVHPLEKILYSSDLENFEAEMTIVTAFAEMLDLKADLAHFYYPAEITLDKETLRQMWQTKYPVLDQVYFEQYNLDKHFPVQLDGLVKKVKPSLVVLFTHTKKTWFDKVFSNHVAESVSFVTEIPMLVYRKPKV